MPALHLWHELTREALRSLAPDALAVLPVGATEQHGPHLPTGTDAFAVEQIARAAAGIAARAIPVVVAPTLPFGSSHHHLGFGGTLSLGTETYYRALCDLAASCVAAGFRRVLFLNGHGGNEELMALAVRDAAGAHPASFAAVTYWDVTGEGFAAAVPGWAGWTPGHAGAFETSLILALRPELVRGPLPERDEDVPGLRQVRRAYRSEAHGWFAAMDGYTDSPHRARAVWGAAWLDAAARAVAQTYTDFHAEANAAEQRQRS